MREAIYEFGSFQPVGWIDCDTGEFIQNPSNPDNSKSDDYSGLSKNYLKVGLN